MPNPNNHKSFLGYVFSNKKDVNILQVIVMLYFMSEIFINNKICQGICEMFGFALIQDSEIRYTIIVLVLIPLSWTFFRVIGNYLKDSESKSFWIYVFSGRRNALILQVPLISCLFSKLISINTVTIFAVTFMILATIFFKAIHLYYLSKYDNNKSDIKKETPHFSRTFSETEQKRLFDGLIAGQYLHGETDFNDFCSVFRAKDYTDTERVFYGLKWIKTTQKTKSRNVRAIFDLLVLLEIPANEIQNKKLINSIFHTGTEVSAKHYTDITDLNHNLKQFTSEYHTDLVSIVSKSKEK
jgi:hypothetical protein